MAENNEKHSVDFSNYNPYYEDVSIYIKACNKARFIYIKTKDIEPYFTAISILVNTTAPYHKTKIGKKKESIIEILDKMTTWIIQYRINRKKFYDKSQMIAKSKKELFMEEEALNLKLLDEIQRSVIIDLSKHKILPRVTMDKADDDDGLPFT